MKNAKCTRNQKARVYLEDIVQSCNPGCILFTEELSIALSTKFRSVSNRTVGRIMSGIEGVKKDRDGVWVTE